MIIRKQPLVKLLICAEQIYCQSQVQARPGHPLIYSELVMFKCFIVKAVKRLHDCDALYNYLAHEANAHIRATVGLSEQLPHRRTFKRRFATSATVMRRQIRAVADVLVGAGVISYGVLSVDGTLCNALGPVWHQSDRLRGHLPDKLRNVDVSAGWGPSGYRGWTYGYSALALCNASWQEPSIFIEGLVASANASETVRVRDYLSEAGLPPGTHYLLGDSGFDDISLFELCRELKCTLIVPVTAAKSSAMSRYQQEALFLEWLDCGLYGRRSASIEPLFGYVKELFELQVLHQHNLDEAGGEIVGAMAAYNLIVCLNWLEGTPLRAVKAFLDVV